MPVTSPGRPPRQGFTLIEVLIVISIIAILAALSIPAIYKAREVANRSVCSNNLRQFGLALTGYHNQMNYYPTAGRGDFDAPNFGTTTSAPLTGSSQHAGWAFQLLPFMDAELIWSGSPTETAAVKMPRVISTPHKFYFCPTRRSMTTAQYRNASFPNQAEYAALKDTTLNVALIDYAACNGNSTTSLNAGLVRTQIAGKSTLDMTGITDGMSHTLVLGEKARGPVVTNEDDAGYATGFSATNYNSIRFTAPTLLPVWDAQLTGATGGAFGSSHPGTWNALMADGSVQQLSYTIDSTIFAALGTVAGKEIIKDSDINP